MRQRLAGQAVRFPELLSAETLARLRGYTGYGCYGGAPDVGVGGGKRPRGGSVPDGPGLPTTPGWEALGDPATNRRGLPESLK